MKHYAAVYLLVFAILTGAAQTPGTVPTIDVISVKSNPQNQGGGVALRADGLYAENAPLRFLIRMAFNQRFADNQIANMPPWADDHFDITVKISSGMPDLHSLDRSHFTELRSQLLQQALTERFQLRTHTEVGQMPIYALIAVKSGAKLHTTPPNPPRDFITADGEHVQLGITVTDRMIAGHSVPLSDLVHALRSAGSLDRVVTDRTGLTGTYDFVVKWRPDSNSATDNGAHDSDLPSLFTAIQEQLGLRLEPSKGPVETLVIDRVEKPSQN